MTLKRIVSTCIAFCLMATLGVAMGGCDDLGVYKDTEEYYRSFGDIVLINGSSGDEDAYSVEKYFYNEESRENFLEGEGGAYKGVSYGDYVYMAIPFESTIDMDTLALYLCAQNDVTVYINVYVTNKIPSDWKAIADNVIGEESNEGTEPTEEPTEEATAEAEPTAETSEGTEATEEAETSAETEKEEKVYDDPDPETRIGEISIHLESGKWDSFMLDTFYVNGTAQKSIEIKEDQFVLLQFRNNSGVRTFDEEKQAFVDPQTNTQLPRAEITMTNLLIRALNLENETEVQGGE